MKAIFTYNHRQLRQHVMDQNFACLGSRSSGGGAGAFDVSPVPPALRTGRPGRLGHVCPLRKKWTWGLLQVLEVRPTGSVLNQAVGRGRGRSKPGRGGPFKQSNLLLTTCVLEYDHCLFIYFFQNMELILWVLDSCKVSDLWLFLLLLL